MITVYLTVWFNLARNMWSVFGIYGNSFLLNQPKLMLKTVMKKQKSSFESDLCMTFGVKMIIFSYYFDRKGHSSNRDKNVFNVIKSRFGIENCPFKFHICFSTRF